MSQMHRRKFMKASAIAGAGYWLTTTALSAARAADRPNGKIQFAGIGVGGKGSSDIDQCVPLGTVVALCDIDDNTLQGKFRQEGDQGRRGRRGNNQPADNAAPKPFAEAKLFHDYREM